MAAVMADSLAAYSGSSGTDTKATPAETETPASESRSEAKEESKTGERNAANTSSSKGGIEGHELALVTDLGTIGDKSFNQGAWEGLKEYAEENSISYKYYQPQEDTTDSYLETISLAIEGDAKLVICPGFLSEEPVYLAQDKYPDVCFILLDRESHDADYNYKTSGNVMPILFQEDQIGSLIGYAVVKDSYTKFGFMGGVAVPVVIHFGYGPVQGVEFVAEEDGITGLKIIYNYTGAFSVAPEAQSMAVSWYQNGTKITFGYSGAVDNFAMTVAQEENAKVIGAGVDQGTESETVITSTMKLPSNSVHDRIRNFYGGNFPRGKTSVFAVANNGVELPMDTSESEKLSQKQHDAVYKELTDGEIGLAQSSMDNSDLTRDLTDLINTKVTFVEQGLAAIRAVQGSEMTCGR